MSANEILSCSAKDTKMAYAVLFFNKFAEHFGADATTAKVAWANFLELKEMEISLNLALSTAFATAKF